MKKRISITIYSIFVSLIFAGTLLFFGLSIYKEYNTSFHRTEERYNELCKDVKKLTGTLQYKGKISQEEILEVCEPITDFSYLKIKINGVSFDIFPESQPVPEKNTKMIRIKFDSFNVNGITASVYAGLYSIRPYYISKYAKISFIIILIFTILTILLIIFANLSDNNELEKPEEKIIIEKTVLKEISKNEDEIVEEETSEEEILEEFDEETEEVIEKEEKTILAQDEQKTETTENEPVVKDGEFEVYNIPALEIQDTEETIVEEVVKEEKTIEKVELPVENVKPAEIMEENPSGLFSPATGLGWESYLQTRLDNELVRASSSDFDLVLFVIRVKGIKRDSETMKNVVSILTETFQYKDMIFEYKEDCFAAIKTNLNIDNALPVADKLHSDISKAVSEENGTCYIGLSSKTIRMVSSERLIKEAEAACSHSQESEESPIIAFRVNTEKYMQFVDKNSNN